MTDILEDLKTLSKVSLFQTESIRKIESGLLTIDAGPEEALDSVLSGNVSLKSKFEAMYGTGYRTVGDFYRDHKDIVDVVDVLEVFSKHRKGGMASCRTDPGCENTASALTIPTVTDAAEGASSVEGFSGSRRMAKDGATAPFTEIWERVVSHAGQAFYTKKGLEFTYRVTGDGFYPSRTRYRIGKSDFAKAYDLDPIPWPSMINGLVRGPAYVWAVLTDPRIID